MKLTSNERRLIEQSPDQRRMVHWPDEARHLVNDLWCLLQKVQGSAPSSRGKDVVGGLLRGLDIASHSVTYELDDVRIALFKAYDAGQR